MKVPLVGWGGLGLSEGRSGCSCGFGMGRGYRIMVVVASMGSGLDAGPRRVGCAGWRAGDGVSHVLW